MTQAVRPHRAGARRLPGRGVLAGRAGAGSRAVGSRAAGSRAAVLGTAGLAVTAVSIGCTLAVAAAGPSLMEPPLPGTSGQPPWSLGLRPAPYLAVGLAAAALAAGVLGLALTLRAIRLGWAISPRRVLLCGVIAAVLTGTIRPFGTSDFLSYAAYGRELVTGHNPYLTAPRALALLGDPVARAVQDWAGTPSVYGALASGVFGAASLLGGTSARLTVFVLDLVNVTAFVGTGILLDRLSRGAAARLRAAVLWTCNPLLLQIVVAGGHVDGLAVVFGVAAIAVLAPLFPNGRPGDSGPAARLPAAGRPSPGVLRAVAAGALFGLGFAVKPTAALVAAGAAIAVAGTAPAARVLCGMAAGFAAVASADILLIGRAGIAQTLRASGMVSVGSPWRVVRTVLSQVVAGPAADDVVRWCSVALAVFLAVLLLRMNVPSRRLLPYGRDIHAGGSGPARAALAVFLGWLLAWPYTLPWYDAQAWALLALLPACGLDWVLLARTAVLALGYLPARSAGVTIPGGLRWMEPVLRSAVTPAVLAALLVLVLWRGAGAIRRTGPREAAGSPPPARLARVDRP